MIKTYVRAKASGRKFRTVRGYTNSNGTKVKAYTRAKVPSRKKRTIYIKK